MIFVMNKWQFKKMQRDLFGSSPTHSELVCRGIAAARAAGVVWGRPRKKQKTEFADKHRASVAQSDTV